MLQLCLWANCISCAVFGAVFLVFPSESASFIGSAPETLIRAIGLVLAMNSVLLAMTAAKFRHLPKVILFFVMGDAGWVILTAACLIFGIWIEGPAAIIASIGVAVLVGGLGFGQYRFGVAPKTRERQSALP